MVCISGVSKSKGIALKKKKSVDTQLHMVKTKLWMK